MRIERTYVSLEQFEDIVRHRDNLLQILENNGENIRLLFATKVNDNKQLLKRSFERRKEAVDDKRSSVWRNTSSIR